MFTILEAFDGIHVFKDGSGNDILVNKSPEDYSFCKVIEGGVATPAPLCSYYQIVSEVYPTSLKEMYGIVDLLAKDPHKVTIRDEYQEQFKGTFTALKRRANYMKQDDRPRSNIIMFDIDELPIPATKRMSCGNDWLEVFAEEVRLALHQTDPGMFPADLGLVVHASSKAGTVRKVKSHIFIENSSRLNQAQLRALADTLNRSWHELGNKKDIVDPAVYNIAQINYFADPIFVDCADPFNGESRVKLFPGSKATIPDSLPEYKKRVNIIVTNDDYNIYKNFSGNRYKQVQSIETDIDSLTQFTKAEGGEGFFRRLQKIYHNALQHGYCMEALDSRLGPIVSDKRPDVDIDNILTTMKNVAIRNIVGLTQRINPRMVRTIPIKTLDVAEDFHLKLADNSIPEGIIFLKASLGTGKTHLIETLIKSGELSGKGVSITNTSALVTSICTRLGAGDYRKDKARYDLAVGSSNKVAGTIHSLWRLEEIADKFDWVFIDECDAVLTDLLTCKLTKQRRNQIIDTLVKLLQSTRTVVLSDGDISEETVDIYMSLIEYQRKCYRINHFKKTLDGIPVTEHPSILSLQGALQGSLEAGQKCLLVADLGPDKLNILSKELSATTGAKVVSIHKNSSEDVDVQDILHDTVGALRRRGVDSLLCSPSVTNGVDFSGYFDATFVITSQKFQTPNLRYQALKRERQSHSVHYFVGHDVKGFKTGAAAELIEPDWSRKSEVALAARKEREFEQFAASFRHYILANGGKLTIEHDPWKYHKPDEDDLYYMERTQYILEATSGRRIFRHNDAYEVKCLLLTYLQADTLRYEEVLDIIKEPFMPWESSEALHVVYAKCWKHIKRCKVGDYKPFIEYLKHNAREFFSLTGWDSTPTVKNVERIFGQLGIKEAGTFDRVLKWYKIYCIENGIPLPIELRNTTEEDELC